MVSSLRHDIQDYLTSFRGLLSRRAVLIALVDAAFSIVTVVLSMLFGALGKSMTSSMMAMTFSLADQADRGAVKWLTIKLLLTAVIFFTSLLVAWLVSRALIWALVAGKRCTKAFAWRFALANLAWFLVLALPFYYLFRGLYASVQAGPTPATQVYYYYHVLFFIVVLYVTYLLDHLFTRQEKVRITLQETARQAVMGLPKIALPFVLMLGTLVLLGFLSKAISALPQAISFILGSVLFFGSFTWAKLYYHTALSKKLGMKRR